MKIFDAQNSRVPLFASQSKFNFHHSLINFFTTKACLDEGVGEKTFCSFQTKDLSTRET